MEEIWKDIPNYEGLYQVSSFGNIKSLARKVYYNDHRGFRINNERKLKPNKNIQGYLYVILYNNGTKKTYMCHKLVAMAFLNHIPCGFDLVVNHINFNKTDNNVNNLEIVTMRENSNQKHLQSSSKYVGVRYVKRDKKWMSAIVYKNKSIYLGKFDNEEEASEYYKKALFAIENGNEIEVKKHISSSKFKGVSLHKSTNKWRASKYNKNIKKLVSLGLYNSEEEANKVVIDYCKKNNL